MKQSATFWRQILDRDLFSALMPLCKDAEMSMVTAWRSGVYHLRRVCHMYLEADIRVYVTVLLGHLCI